MPALWFSAILAFFLSFFAKLFADAYVAGGRIALLGDFAGLQFSENMGVAFGVRFPPVLQTALIVCAAALVLWMALSSKRSALAECGYGLVVGGAFCNIVDRLWDGRVTDFFQVGTFPIFNVADSCITVGVGLLLLELLLAQWGKPTEPTLVR